MNKKKMLLLVKGNEQQWGFYVYADPKYVQAWKADGLNITVLRYTIPIGIFTSNSVMVHIWCFFQDIWQFRNPFRKSAIKDLYR